MFVTPKIPAYVQKASLEGKEKEQLVRFTFYITPILHALACEMSPAIGDRLFKSDASGKPQPISEIELINFDIGTIDLQEMTLYPVADPAMEDHGVLLKAVQISNVSARKLFPDDPKFSLIFNAEIPKNDLSFSMMGKYFKQPVFLTFETMQPQLPMSDRPMCAHCSEAAVAQDSEESYLCGDHVKRGKGEVVFITKKETPAEAEARVKAAAAIPDDDKRDTSHINRKRVR